MPDSLPSDWPHAPPHRLAESGVYFVTARTLGRVAYLSDDERLSFARDRLLELGARYGWRMEAWAVLNNHYHFVAQSPRGEDGAISLRKWLRHLHADIAREVNRLDATPGRKVWHNFRETLLTHRKSYLARLHYTHANAVHHGLVAVAGDYPWCSASAWMAAETSARVKTVMSFAFEEIAVADQDDD